MTPRPRGEGLDAAAIFAESDLHFTMIVHLGEPRDWQPDYLARYIRHVADWLEVADAGTTEGAVTNLEGHKIGAWWIAAPDPEPERIGVADG
jgi:hypothetical protein